ncbi:hypothetical protein C8R44DRAFT_869817 [Mycena epipterygia]|nr:hypothetical protein C8R44DRAFT_869817 [Mycena epipterygia]
MFDQSDKEYPWDDPELAALAAAMGMNLAEERHRMQETLRNNTWQVNSLLGYGSHNHTDIRVRPVNNQYSVVFWGGRAAEATEFWSFHIARARPKNDKTGPQFDEVLDRHVNLAEERLRVLAEPTYVALRDGGLGAPEGGTVHLEHSPVGGLKTVTPITFPLRQRGPNGVILTV